MLTNETYREIFDELGIEYQLRADGRIDNNFALRHDGTSLLSYLNFQDALIYLAVNSRLGDHLDLSQWNLLEPEAISSKKVSGLVRAGKRYAVHPKSGQERQAIASLFGAFLGVQLIDQPLIQSITIENFKGIGEPVTIPLRPITLLFGKNSAGKSTVLHALLYALEVIQSGNWDAGKTTIGGDAVDLGGFKNLVHKHEKDRLVRLRFDLDLSGVTWTTAPDKTARRRSFPIDEFNVGSRGTDLSGVGDSVESAWIELVIGESAGDYAGVAHIDIGYDDKLFARMGRFTQDLVYAPDAKCRAVLNMLHPLFFEGSEHEYCMFGHLTGDDFLMEQYRFYYGLEPYVEQYDPETIDASVAAEGSDGSWKVHRELEDFHLETMRCIAIGEDDPAEFCLVEIGATRDLGVLAVHRSFGDSFWNEGGLSDRRPFAELHFGGADGDPELENFTEAGVPDWRKPFCTGYPVALLRESGIASKVSLDDFELAAATRFLDQMLERLLYGPLVWLRDELASMCYLGPIRDVPERAEVPPKTPVPARWSTGLAAWDELRNDAELLQHCSATLQRIGINYELRREHIYRIDPEDNFYHFLQNFGTRFEDFDGKDFDAFILQPLEERREVRVILVDKKHDDLVVSPGDVGTGVAQVIPVIVGALDVEKRIFSVEQPELHVHPAAQCGLADVFIMGALRCRTKAGQNEQPFDRLMLIETHSEHVMLRIMKRMRQTFEQAPDLPFSLRLTPDKVSVLAVEQVKGRTCFRPMPLNERGDLVKAWPGGFFEERTDELFD